MTDQPTMPHLKDLPHLFQTIRRRSLSGRLTWKDGDDRAHLFFHNGYPIHAQVDMYGQIGEDAIDWVLTRHEGNFQWTPADELFNPANSITNEMSENLDRLVTIMVEGEILNRPDDDDYDLAFFAIKPKIRVAPLPPAARRDVVVVRFPPGEPDSALSEQLQQLDFNGQIAHLQQQRFSGYLYYQPAQGNEFMALGMVVFEDGVLTLAHATELITDTAHSGDAAYQHLAPQANHVNAYRSSSRVLKAFRAIMQAQSRDSQPATKATLQHALATAKAQHTTGAIALRDPEHQQELYLLVSQGQAIGLVAPEAGGNRLVQLAQNHPLPLGTPTATLMVLKTPDAPATESPSTPAAPQPTIEPATPAALPPAMYASLVQAFQIMSLLATQFVGQERAAATIAEAFEQGIQQGSIPATWQTMVQAQRAAVAWPATVHQLGDAVTTLNALTYLWDQVYGTWANAIGQTKFLELLLRAWGTRGSILAMLHQAPIQLPFAEALASHEQKA